MANIFDFLRSLGELEQTGGDYREGSGDVAFLAPVIVFRHKHRTQELADRLTTWTAEFHGEFRWHLHYSVSGPGINSVLAPQILWDIAEHQGLKSIKAAREWLLKQDPACGQRARLELDCLADHLAARWKESVERERA